MSDEMERIRRDCEARFPGLLGELPVERYVTMLRRAGLARSYHELPASVRSHCRDIERRHGTKAVGLLQKLVLIHFLEHPSEREWPLRLTTEARALQNAELTRIRLELRTNPAEYYEGSSDPFLKDLGLCSGHLLYLGAQLVEPCSRFPKRLLLLRNPVAAAEALIRVARAGGLRRTWVQFHTSERHLNEFNEAGWLMFYERLSDLLKLNPRIGGVFSVSWYFDPALASVSPRLVYLRALPESGGALSLFVAHDRESAHLATRRSPTRRGLVEAGTYRPASYMLLWPRNALIRRESDQGLRRLRRTVKTAALRALKALGAFHVARHLSRRKLRILCYHGMAQEDQHEFDDILFIRPESFERRIAALRRWKMTPVPLAETLRGLREGRHPDHSIALTFDDGWRSTGTAITLLDSLGIPSTLYVATHYVETGTNVFNVLVRYLFWKSKAAGFEGHDLRDPSQATAAVRSAIDRGEDLAPREQEELIDELAHSLGVDLSILEQRSLFRYFTLEELRALPASVDLQLHTHRHDLPHDPDGIRREISRNRAALAKVRSGPFEHICYPSGIFSEAYFGILESLGILSATTVENFLNSPRSHPLRLGRFVDRDNLSDIEFEAEITGTMPLLRALLGGARSRSGASQRYIGRAPSE